MVRLRQGVRTAVAVPVRWYTLRRIIGGAPVMHEGPGPERTWIGRVLAVLEKVAESLGRIFNGFRDGR